MTIDAGLMICTGCTKPKPISLFEVVRRRNGAMYRRRKCLACRKREQAARDRSEYRRMPKPRRYHDQSEYYHARKLTLLGRLVAKKAKARDRIRHWQAVEESLDRQIAEVKAS